MNNQPKQCEKYQAFQKNNNGMDVCPCLIRSCKEKENWCANISSSNFGEICVEKIILK